MKLLSFSKLFGTDSAVNLFRCIFDEYAIPSLQSFYNIWDGDNMLNSMQRSIRRMTESPPKSYTKKYRVLAECLCNPEAFLMLSSHVDSFQTKCYNADTTALIVNIANEIRMELADDSRFSATLSLLIERIQKPYAKPHLLTWCILYAIFGHYYTAFAELYDITNPITYREIYSDIIDGEKLLMMYRIYQNKSAQTLPAKALAYESEASDSSGNQPLFIDGKATSTLFVNKYFVGRSREMAELEEILRKDKKIFLQGMGGIGKSQLAKAYAHKHRDEYRTILFLSYEYSLCDTIINEQQLHIDGINRYFKFGRIESDAEYFQRKLDKLKSFLKNDSLLILDNYDTDYDPHLEDLLTGAYSVIVTSRNHYPHLGLPILQLQPLDAETDQMTLLRTYYRLPLSVPEKACVAEILRHLCGHTYAIELISKLMFSKRIAPSAMLEILQSGGISPDLQGNISHGFDEMQSVYDNIHNFFTIDKLSSRELFLLYCLSLIPLNGIGFEDFAALCELEECDILTQLCNKSWIQYQEQGDLISLHPLIADIISHEYTPDGESFGKFLDHFSYSIANAYYMTYEERYCHAEIALKIYRKLPLKFPEHYTLLHNIGILLMRMEYIDISMEIFSKCRRYVRDTYGEYSKPMAEIYQDDCDCALLTADYQKAASLIQTSIDIFRRIDDTDLRLAYYIKMKAWCLIDTVDLGSDMTEIFQLMDEYRELSRGRIDDDDPQIASMNAALAYAYCYSGQYREALLCAEKSYNVFYRLYGEEHADTICPLAIKALTFSCLGHHSEAISLCNHVIQIQKKLFGETHTKVLKRIEMLGKIYVNAGKLTEARVCLDYAASVLKQRLATDNDFYKNVMKWMKKTDDACRRIQTV